MWINIVFIYFFYLLFYLFLFFFLLFSSKIVRIEHLKITDLHCGFFFSFFSRFLSWYLISGILQR